MLFLIWFTLVHLYSTETISSLPVIVVPQHLNFGPHNIGYVAYKNLSIYNNADRDVYIAADYDSRSVFQPTVSRSKTVLLERNEKFELGVMFLPHTVGETSGNFKLYIYTISNTIPGDIVTINVKGVGHENPYGLTPFVGVKWPTSVAYSPTINIYNPHDRELRIKEMYTSGGNINLVPPINEAKTWRVAPYETKPIMRLNLFSEHSYNHLSYVTVRLEEPDHPDIKLPIDVDLVSTAGVFPMPTSINFGKFSRSCPPKVVGIYLLSTYNCTAKVFTVSITDSILHQNGISIKLLRDGLHASHRGMFQKIADVTIDPAQLPELVENGHNKHVGNVSIKFSNSKVPSLNIPFTAHVYQGALELSGFKEGFYSGEILQRLYQKHMTLYNSYDIPLAIKDMDLKPLEDDFIIEDLHLPFVINPKERIEFAKFTLKKQGSKFSKDFILKVETNLTTVEFPIPVYNGDVDVHVDNKDNNVLNFELLGYNQTRYKIVKLYNKNPVTVDLLYYFTNVPFCDGYYTRLWRNDAQRMIKLKKDDAIQRDMVQLGPMDYIEINVTITTPSMAHNVSGFFVIETGYDFVQLPLQFRTLEGKLLTTHLDFTEVFPGKTNEFSLLIANSFNETFPLESIRLEPSSMITLVRDDEPVFLKALASSEVGKIEFNPERVSQYSYLMTDDAKKQKEFLKGHRLNVDQVDYELKLYKHLRGKWNSLQKNGKNKLTIKGSVKSSFADNSPIAIDVDLVWPSLIKESQVFPVTHVKDTSTSTVTLFNPSKFPVHMEVFFINFYPHSRALVDILGLRHEATNLDATFSLRDAAPDFIDRFVNGNDVSGKVKFLVLQPMEEKTITVQFSPIFVGAHKNVLVLRNNLTLFESLLFNTMAAKGDIVFEKRTQLLLNMHENLLSECHHAEEGSIEKGYFNTNRSFTLRNVGDITSKVMDIQINGISCSAYGVTVLNCAPFDVEPNQHHVLKFNFIPNFHFSYVEYTLTVVPSAGDPLEIPLITKVPNHMLNLCSDKIQRPIWEVSFRIILLSGTFCALLIVFCHSYIFFSQPIVISQTSIKPIIIQKPSEPPKPIVVPRKIPKRSSLEKSVVLPSSRAPETPSKTKKRKESIKIKDPVRVSPDIGKYSPPVTKDSPKTAKKKVTIAPTVKPEPPKALEVAPQKPAKMTSIVKPRIKEQPIKEAALKDNMIIKKAKDVHVVKPELKHSRSNAAPSMTESKYRLSKNLSTAVTTPTEESPDIKLEQKFNRAVEEELKRKQRYSKPFYPEPPPSWTHPSNTLATLSQPTTVMSPALPTMASPSPPLTTASYQPLTSVDDWFAPNAQNPFTHFNLPMSNRQTSRLQSMFSMDQPKEEENTWSGIWGPLRLDQEEQTWKTE